MDLSSPVSECLLQFVELMMEFPRYDLGERVIGVNGALLAAGRCMHLYPRIQLVQKYLKMFTIIYAFN